MGDHFDVALVGLPAVPCLPSRWSDYTLASGLKPWPR